jgi:threonine synthase
MRFVSTRAPRGVPGGTRGVSLGTALFDGLALDGGLYVPETIDRWPAAELNRLSSYSLAELGARVLGPFAAGEIDQPTIAAVVGQALDFPIPLVEIEPGIFALELFHGPTLAFKDVGARVMARLMAALGSEITVLTATSGDTGSAVANAFYGITGPRVVILYPDGRVSPTQEAQLTMFNHEEASNVRSYAVAGSFDDCQRLVKEAFADTGLRRRVRLTSANSINVGRLLPQMIYYFHAVAQLQRARPADAAPTVCTPSGNFGNLTAGIMAARAGVPIAGFVAATNVNDVVPAYLDTGRFEPRPSMPTIANAMDVGNPSNFERLSWLYGGNLEAMRRDISGSRQREEDVRGAIGRVHAESGYVLDPHSAIGYLGIKERVGKDGLDGRVGIFLATAHPAKFSEVVEPVIGRAIEMPAPLAHALAQPKRIYKTDATLAAVRKAVGA